MPSTEDHYVKLDKIKFLLTDWPLSKTLLIAILDDYISDRFVVELVWKRLGYQLEESSINIWVASNQTPLSWRKTFPKAPEVIAQRNASVHLTRSIPKANKQLLKEKLDFPGFSLKELFPRKVRRATVVNWLLSWMEERGFELPAEGPMPRLSKAPINPLNGHPGDPVVE